jgi:pimeloyl-ACP methyl ester carboxylesterase
MLSFEHIQLSTSDVELHLVYSGEGPLVVLCHGFPGLWYSWRHQIPEIAKAGYRVVALDMRGYGRSSRPLESDAYGYDCLAGDILAVLDHFGEEKAVIVGHDFGANLAWHMAVHYPERFRGVASLCVPYDMALAGGSDILPSELFASIAAEHFFHMHYYQTVGLAEKGWKGREREFLLKLFWALCAEGELLSWENFPSEGVSYTDVLSSPARDLPWSWISEEEFEYYLSEYMCDGTQRAFIGGANAYRVMDRNWRMFRNTAHAEVNIPATFIGGEEDPVVKLGSEAEFDHMRDKVKDLRGLTLIPDAGHFVQQEQAQATTALLLEFLNGL